MVKYSFIFFIIFLIGLVTYFIPVGASSVVPGWHTTVFSPWFLAHLSQVLWLGIVSLIYYLLERNGKRIPHRIFLLHIALSLSVFTENLFLIPGDISSSMILQLSSVVLFVLGQIFFMSGVLMAKKGNIPNAQ